jgi:glycosidase
MANFEALIKRTHRAGLDVIMDFVPNHVSRAYKSLCRPQGIDDLGAHDDRSVAFAHNNNFYYIPEQPLQLPHDPNHTYTENPARATGNDRFDAYPQENDWYETIKLNYTTTENDTWRKMLHILLFWAAKGVDGFRCDMAEMVPVEFWHYAIGKVKRKYPRILFIAEVYNPDLYRSYINEGGFDYLYDKVGLYDTLRGVVMGNVSPRAITQAWQSTDGLQSQMLNFLENHDEQRIASDFFAADPRKALPAVVVSATINTGAFMLYCGQELGERGMDNEGFSGIDGRTSIFDYCTPDTLRRWLSSETDLTQDELALRAYYTRLLRLVHQEPAISEGKFYDLMYANPDSANFNGNTTYAFLRKHKDTLLLIVSNFDGVSPQTFLPDGRSQIVRADTALPAHAFEFLSLPCIERTQCACLLTGKKLTRSLLPNRPIPLTLSPYGSCILRFNLHS